MSNVSSNWILSVKVGVLSLTAMCVAMAMKLSLPTVTEFAYSELPPIWTTAMTWLKPPYLYVVINGIIITIVASSKLHHRKAAVDPSPVTAVYDANLVKVLEYDVYSDAVLPVEEETKVVTSYMNHVEKKTKVMTSVVNPMEEDKMTMMTITSSDANGVNEVAISKMPNSNSADFSIYGTEKPPVSVRIGHRKSVKSVSEGGRALRVSKPKRQETLENTWKTITEGHSIPLTRHLRKSDTWETHNHHLPQDRDPKMTKSETFHDSSTDGRHIRSSDNPTPGLGKLRKEPSGSWKLRKDPSLSQDDLNHRVEAFINKFNEDMRLQRQESLNQYMQMINRGAH